jgi:uncharacterized membrane protein YjgN (DUF898 family)
VIILCSMIMILRGILCLFSFILIFIILELLKDNFVLKICNLVSVATLFMIKKAIKFPGRL